MPRKSKPTTEEDRQRLGEIAARLFELGFELAGPDTELRLIEEEIRRTYARGFNGVYLINLTDEGGRAARRNLWPQMDWNNRRYSLLRTERASLRREERRLQKALEQADGP